MNCSMLTKNFGVSPTQWQNSLACIIYEMFLTQQNASKIKEETSNNSLKD
jgi:hypothetical protein